MPPSSICRASVSMAKGQHSFAAVATVQACKSTVTGCSAGRSPTDAAIRTIAALPSSTGTMPLLTQFDRKIGLNDEATTARNPYSTSAQAACSRLDPHPKLAPERRIFRSEEHTYELQSLMRTSYAV